MKYRLITESQEIEQLTEEISQSVGNIYSNIDYTYIQRIKEQCTIKYGISLDIDLSEEGCMETALNTIKIHVSLADVQAVIVHSRGNGEEPIETNDRIVHFISSLRQLVIDNNPDRYVEEASTLMISESVPLGTIDMNILFAFKKQ